MNDSFFEINSTSSQSQGYQWLLQGDYANGISFYEKAIQADPTEKSSYWYLGLILLLNGQEEEAQTTWLLGMVEGNEEQLDQWTRELIQVLEAEAQRRKELEDYSVVWLIRQHIREIMPQDINNLLSLIQVSIQQERFTGDELREWELISLLEQNQPVLEVEENLLLATLRDVLDYDPLHPAALDFVEVSIAYIQNLDEFLKIILITCSKLGYWKHRPDLAIRLGELYLRLDSKNVEVLFQLAVFYQSNHQYQQGIQTAKLCYSILENLPDRIYASLSILRCLMASGGVTQEVFAQFKQHKILLLSLIQDHPNDLTPVQISRLVNSYYFAPYLQDQAKDNRIIQNKLSSLCQVNFQKTEGNQSKREQKKSATQVYGLSDKQQLRIGYLSSCLKEHSVGWLARWLFQYHNRERFYIVGYFPNYDRGASPLEQWYMENVAHSYYTVDPVKMANQIAEDEIDILIDLDSLTLDVSCEIVARKPAPVQVTWLGWDASGIPAVDYFIADPYVLPEYAQEYYSEKIWRLPQTYIAVDGFEVGVPTLRRDNLNIPNDAVVYYSGQRGYKRHPDTARLQMKILKAVPNSYFLIKGIADEEAIKNFFTQLAEEEGVDPNCLRFLPHDRSEAVHRANLGIADVVLDTYPYNGATTTMETLWMGIPMVTRVGEQFAARNSYTMMINAGITEGIAWSDEEYVEWGIRLGKDEKLRQDISWRLRQGRQTAPLWNAKQFTREMEKAYEQMWEIYVQNNAG